MQYKSRLSSKPPAPTRGVQMRIKRREIIPSAGSGSKGGSVGPTKTTTTTTTTATTTATATHTKGLSILLFGGQECTYGDKLRKQQMMKELLLKRALSPPPRRLTLRWKNFQPSPSRLSIMSSA